MSDIPGHLWHVPLMALDKSDLEAIQLLLREGIGNDVSLLRKEMRSRFNQIEDLISQFETQVNAQFTEVQNNFEALFARDEKREHENLALNEQIKRHDERIETLERKVA